MARATGETGPDATTETAAPAAGTHNRALVSALAVALAGAVVLVVLGGLLAFSAGLLVVAAVVGWAIGRTTRTADAARPGTRTAVATILAVGCVGLAQAGLWVVARAEGGVLSPVEYLAQTWGVLVPLQLLAAVAASWWASR